MADFISNSAILAMICPCPAIAVASDQGSRTRKMADFALKSAILLSWRNKGGSMTAGWKLPTEESAIYALMEEESLAIQLGITMARRFPPRRVAVLAYAPAFAVDCQYQRSPEPWTFKRGSCLWQRNRNTAPA